MGFVTGLGLSEIGHQVINVDVDQDRILQLQGGGCLFHEPGVEGLLQRNLDAGRIRFSSDLDGAVAASQIVLIAVGTPSLDNGHADLSQIIEVSEGLARCIQEYKLIVIKSTAPVGTVELVRTTLGRNQQETRDFDIVVNPEFLREGHGLDDFFYPDRIVIGGWSEQARSLVRELYGPIIKGEVTWGDLTQDGGKNASGGKDSNHRGPVPVVETDPATAQMIKYSSTAFLAARISFINEIAGLCEKVGADVTEVSRGMGYDPRIGHAYLNAGPGFGGPCLEKDLRALMTVADSNGYETQLLQAVLDRNQRQIEQVLIKLKGLVGQVLDGKTVAVFGLAFKAGTNDVRNSMAVKVIDRLEKEGATVRLHDPQARILSAHAEQCEDPYVAVRDADALLILTEWPFYKELDYQLVKDSMATAQILDTRNLLNSNSMRELGFTYAGMGVP